MYAMHVFIVCVLLCVVLHLMHCTIMSAADGRSVITLCDIYHIATDLRHEFERLMASYGPENFSLLVPPVVQSLELLEYMMEAQHRDGAQLEDLRNYVDLLNAEKHSSTVLKEKYEKVRI